MIIGVDIGASYIKSGIVSRNKIIKKVVLETGKNKKEVIDNIIKSIEVLFDKKIQGIGIGCPGPADYKKGIIRNSPNIPLNGVNIKKVISQKFKKKVIIENDADCFAIGESMRLKTKNLVGLTLGTGIGGGIIVDGKLLHGKGNAGHIGHSTIKFDGVQSKCGNNCVEKLYRDARASRKDFAKYLGIALANINNILDPEVISIGGGVSNTWDSFYKKMMEEFRKRTINKMPRVLKGAKYSGIIGVTSLFLS
ncbi:MAG: ROK family protein [Candidatus Woesearchaeota archaeon]|nr:MAG: ROK family protein [Candidatus Woesearchaeota archaeon]